MRNLLILMMIALFVGNSNPVKSQTENSELLRTKRILENIADNIMQHTSFSIIDKKTGKTYLESKDLAIDAKYRVESPYNEWKYWNGVMNIGFMQMADYFKDTKYSDYARKNVAFAFDHEDFFKKQYDAGVCKGDMSQRYRLKMLDDCGAMGAGVLAVHEVDPQKRYKKYLDVAANYITNEEFRLADGTFCRESPYKMTIWGDDLYMSVPFLARMGALTGDQKYFDDAAKQVINFNKYLWDEQTRIFFHCWYDDIKQNGVAHWGRCNGWIIVAQVELLDKLPKDHPKRDELISLLTRQIIGLSRYQDVSGLWHQLIDRNETYLETSSTAMFTYSIAKAINEGWLDARYAYVALQGWRGLMTKVTADGQVEGICKGTGISSATYYYAQRPTPLNDIHGLGAVMLAGCEILKLQEKGIKELW